MALEFSDGNDGDGDIETLDSLRKRARALTRHCMPDVFGAAPKPEGLEEEPLYITNLLNEVIDLAKREQTRVSDKADESDDAEIYAEDITWPQHVIDKRDTPVLLFGFAMRAATPEEKKVLLAEGQNPDAPVRSETPQTPLIAQLPGTPQALVDMYEAYVHGVTELESYWEDTWDEFGLGDGGASDMENEDAEEIRQMTEDLAKEIDEELQSGGAGKMTIHDLQRAVSDLDDTFDQSVIHQENLHQKIDELAKRKFVVWLHRIPQGPKTHFDKITRAIQSFPFSENTGTRAELQQIIRKAARISAHRQKIGWNK